MDVVALYPSLNQKEDAREVAGEYLESNLKIEGVDIRDAVVYLAVNCERSEIIKDGMTSLIPRRLHRKGTKPTIRSKELAGGWTRTNKCTQ